MFQLSRSNALRFQLIFRGCINLQTVDDFFCINPEHELGLLVGPECAGNDDVGPWGQVKPSGDLTVVLVDT